MSPNAILIYFHIQKPSKKQFKRGKDAYKSSGLGKWTAAVQKARKEMGITGFVVRPAVCCVHPILIPASGREEGHPALQAGQELLQLDKIRKRLTRPHVRYYWHTNSMYSPYRYHNHYALKLTDLDLNLS